ncbi:MAG: hypothetical protein NUV91_02910, partial [Candidatus Omnitrophica bacterium]|nr:hypothetical protein [Candidatus Omnitrophota bacterium]
MIFIPFLRKNCFVQRILALFVMICWGTNSLVPLSVAEAQSILGLHTSGVIPLSTTQFSPVVLKGVKLSPTDPLRLDFIVDTGNTDLQGEKLRWEITKLIKYFLATITVPSQDLWVNLSPQEPDRIAPQALGMTQLGRDLLAQDYILKQITASMIYPDGEQGKEFWGRIYQKAQKMYGTTKVPINTFHKVWVVPQKAVVYEHEDSGFVAESQLDVLLEEDYLSRKASKNLSKIPATDDISSAIMRDIILPELKKEVNEGQHFAPLRQIYNSMILAAWFKKTLQKNILSKIYVGKNKVLGVDVKDKAAKEKIYDAYLKAFKKGAYNFIKEEVDPATQQVIPRKYFAGGMEFRDKDGGDLGGLVQVTRSVAAGRAAGEAVGTILRAPTRIEPKERLSEILRRVARSPKNDLVENASEGEVMELLLDELAKEGLIIETQDADGNAVIAIKEEAKQFPLGQEIFEQVIEPQGELAVKAVNFQSSSTSRWKGQWMIVGFVGELKDQEIFRHEQAEIKYRKQGLSWEAAHNASVDETGVGQKIAGDTDQAQSADSREPSTLGAGLIDMLGGGKYVKALLAQGYQQQELTVKVSPTGQALMDMSFQGDVWISFEGQTVRIWVVQDERQQLHAHYQYYDHISGNPSSQEMVLTVTMKFGDNLWPTVDLQDKTQPKLGVWLNAQGKGSVKKANVYWKPPSPDGSRTPYPQVRPSAPEGADQRGKATVVFAEGKPAQPAAAAGAKGTLVDTAAGRAAPREPRGTLLDPSALGRPDDEPTERLADADAEEPTAMALVEGFDRRVGGVIGHNVDIFASRGVLDRAHTISQSQDPVMSHPRYGARLGIAPLIADDEGRLYLGNMGRIRNPTRVEIMVRLEDTGIYAFKGPKYQTPWDATDDASLEPWQRAIRESAVVASTQYEEQLKKDAGLRDDEKRYISAILHVMRGHPDRAVTALTARRPPPTLSRQDIRDYIDARLQYHRRRSVADGGPSAFETARNQLMQMPELREQIFRYFSTRNSAAPMVTLAQDHRAFYALEKIADQPLPADLLRSGEQIRLELDEPTATLPLRPGDVNGVSDSGESMAGMSMEAGASPSLDGQADEATAREAWDEETSPGTSKEELIIRDGAQKLLEVAGGLHEKGFNDRRASNIAYIYIHTAGEDVGSVTGIYSTRNPDGVAPVGRFGTVRIHTHPANPDRKFEVLAYPGGISRETQDLFDAMVVRANLNYRAQWDSAQLNDAEARLIFALAMMIATAEDQPGRRLVSAQEAVDAFILPEGENPYTAQNLPREMVQRYQMIRQVYEDEQR